MFFNNYRMLNAGKAHLRAKLDWVNWNVRTSVFGVIVGFTLLFLAYPFSMVLEMGFNKQSLSWMGGFFTTFFPYFFDYWIPAIWDWIKESNRNGAFLLPLSMWIAIVTPIFVIIIGTSMNPHWALPSHFGRAREADYRTIKKMGVLNGWLVILGKWQRKYLMLKETLTVLCMAPPGTGKTTGVVVPTMLSCDALTMIVNDVKPEIARMTSGYRETVSCVFVLEWAASDDPEINLFYPRWNPLSPGVIPPAGANRDLYIDRLTNVIVEEPKGNQDPHWTIKGRAALAGMIHFIAAKVESGSYEGLPAKWHGEEASLPMMIDWLNEGVYNASKVIEELRQTDPNAALMADPMREFLSDAANESMENNYSSRAFLELNQLANTPDKERGSILSTMDGGLIVFKNSAVVARTSASDFEFIDTRGMIDQDDGQMKPMTVYLCVNLEDAKALGTITGIFVETLTAWLVAHAPGAKDKAGRKAGPYPVLFVLDEFPQMPKLDALMKGPEVGRGQKVSYLLIGQDLAQVEETYGKTGVERFFSNSFAKIILPMNNDAAAKRIGDMIGKVTIIEKSRSREEGIGANVNPFKANVTKSYKEHMIWAGGDILNMEKGIQLVLIQGFTRRPIVCQTPFFFKDPKFRRMVSPGDGGVFPAAPPMPDWKIRERIEKYQEEKKELEKLSAEGKAPTAPGQSQQAQAAQQQDESIYARIIIMFSDVVAIDEDTDTAIMEIACAELQDGEVTGNNFHIFCKLSASDLEEYKENVAERVPEWLDSYAVSVERLGDETDPERRAEALASEEAKEVSEKVPLFSDIASEFIEWINPSPVVSYNAGLEFGVLNPELMKADYDPIPGERIFSVIDWSKENLPDANSSIIGLANHFGVDAVEEEHGLRYLQYLAGIYLKVEEIEINNMMATS